MLIFEAEALFPIIAESAMKRFFIVLVLFMSGHVFAEPMIGRVTIADRAEIEALRNLGFTIYHDELKGVVDLVLEKEDIRLLQELGYEPTGLVSLPEFDQVDLDPEYHTYEELTDELQTLAASYPGLCKLDSIGQTSVFDRTIWCVKLSDNVQEEEDEIALLYIGIHHACEPLGGETILYMINTFLENYGVDPQITQWLDDYEIFFIPLLNPDGHYAVTSGIDEFWRKNARDTNNNGIYYEFLGGTWWTDDTDGVDLNRNYKWYWELGGSGDPWAYDYRGAFPFSEDELQGLKPLAVQQRFVCAITFHSYGEVIIYPWDFNSQPAPDQDVLDAMAVQMASQFIKDNGGTYNYYTENGRNGQCRNWFYGFAGVLTFCVELNPYPVFLPPGSQLAERTQRYMNGAVYLLERLSGPGITGHVTDAVTGEPLGARVEIQGRISDQVKPRFAEPTYGRFTRLLENGTYTVLAGMPGYYVERVENVVVQDTLTVLNIALTPDITVQADVAESGPSPHADVNVRNLSGTSFEFMLNLNRPDEVDLIIYNVLGKKAAIVQSGFLNAGNHRIQFDGSGLPSGVYIYRLTAGEYTASSKMVLMK